MPRPRGLSFGPLSASLHREESKNEPKTASQGLVELSTVFENCTRLEVLDKRTAGGALWVIGGAELSPLMEELKTQGIAFTLAPQGGRASRHRPAWYTKWTDAAAPGERKEPESHPAQ